MKKWRGEHIGTVITPKGEKLYYYGPKGYGYTVDIYTGRVKLIQEVKVGFSNKIRVGAVGYNPPQVKSFGKVGIGEMSPQEFTWTEKFKKAIKGHDARRIKNAIEKIEYGLGNPHPLKGQQYKGLWAVKASKGGRIVYNPETGELVDFLPGHGY